MFFYFIFINGIIYKWLQFMILIMFCLQDVMREKIKFKIFVQDFGCGFDIFQFVIFQIVRILYILFVKILIIIREF